LEKRSAHVTSPLPFGIKRRESVCDVQVKQATRWFIYLSWHALANQAAEEKHFGIAGVILRAFFPCHPTLQLFGILAAVYSTKRISCGARKNTQKHGPLDG
jgi:hypothetical protein